MHCAMCHVPIAPIHTERNEQQKTQLKAAPAQAGSHTRCAISNPLLKEFCQTGCEVSFLHRLLDCWGEGPLRDGLGGLEMRKVCCFAGNGRTFPGLTGPLYNHYSD